MVQYSWDQTPQVLAFTPVWNKNASWKLSEKKKVIFDHFFMSFWIRVELIAREIFHNLDKNKTIWIQNVNNWCSTPETRTHKFWFSPQCEIKMLHENYRKKRKSFSITFLCPFELGLSSSPVKYFTIWTKTKRFEFKMWTIGAVLLRPEPTSFGCHSSVK